MALPQDLLEQRQIISLIDLGEPPYCDVAQALDIPVATMIAVSTRHKTIG